MLCTCSFICHHIKTAAMICARSVWVFIFIFFKKDVLWSFSWGKQNFRQDECLVWSTDQSFVFLFVSQVIKNVHFFPLFLCEQDLVMLYRNPDQLACIRVPLKQVRSSHVTFIWLHVIFIWLLPFSDMNRRSDSFLEAQGRSISSHNDSLIWWIFIQFPNLCVCVWGGNSLVSIFGAVNFSWCSKPTVEGTYRENQTFIIDFSVCWMSLFYLFLSLFPDIFIKLWILLFLWRWYGEGSGWPEALWSP